MRLQVLRAAGRIAQPWKNGGGTTSEIAAFPPGAGLDAFDWRVSVAEVAASGPFSTFHGVDRTLTVLSGDGFELRMADADPVTLGETSAPYSFPGDAPVTATLRRGPITDLNVMTRRGRWTHTVERLPLTEGQVLPAAGVLLAFARTPIEIATRAGPVRLEVHDAVQVDDQTLDMWPPPGQLSDLVLIRLRPA